MALEFLTRLTRHDDSSYNGDYYYVPHATHAVKRSRYMTFFSPFFCSCSRARRAATVRHGDLPYMTCPLACLLLACLPAMPCPICNERPSPRPHRDFRFSKHKQKIAYATTYRVTGVCRRYVEYIGYPHHKRTPDTHHIHRHRWRSLQCIQQQHPWRT